MSAVSYARAALDTECATLAATRRGRNAQANRSGFAMGQFRAVSLGFGTRFVRFQFVTLPESSANILTAGHI